MTEGAHTGIVTARVPGRPRIACEHAGLGPLAVFLHGIGGNRTNWREQLAALAPRYTAVAWDARGYGDSDDYPGRLRFADFSADLERLLDHLDARRAHLVGLSMGGRIAQHFYFTRPERVATLTLVSTHAGFSHLSPERRERYLEARRAPLLAGAEPRDIAPALVRELAGPAADGAVRGRLHDSIAALRKESYLKALDATVRQTHIGDLETIGVPTHCVVGACDRLTTPELMEEMARSIPGARLTVIGDAGHLCNIERPEAFNAALTEFLDAHRERADAPSGSVAGED